VGGVVGGCRGENKVPKAKKRKKKGNRVGGGGKIKLQKKAEIRAEKVQTKKVNLGWHRDRKENPISAPSIHVGALMGAGSLWPNDSPKEMSGFHSFYLMGYSLLNDYAFQRSIVQQCTCNWKQDKVPLLDI
jgi:hypothetical protein